VHQVRGNPLDAQTMLCGFFRSSAQVDSAFCQPTNEIQAEDV